MRGIGLKVLSVAVFMAMATCIKAAAPDIPPGEAVFFRSFFAIPVILGWLVWQGNLRHGLETQNPMGHLWRGLVGTAAMAMGFTALGLLPLPEVTAIGYAAPLLIVIFAAMFLGEEVRLFRLTAVLVGLIGVTVVLSPRLTVSSFEDASKWEALGAMAALMGAVFMALAQVFIRKLVQTENTAAIVFYFSVAASVLSLLTLPFGWTFPDTRQALLLVSSGLLGGIGQILLTSSYRYAPTSVIAPFEYVSMLMALVIGYALFGEVPTRTMMFGAGLIILAGLFIIWRERQLGLRRSQARRVMTPQG
ncbi:DMT family transporter [Oceanomicrobium pacificus]|uniref:EamA family transporter n=1 Tax=Oceanomicrobium pacificus TaxID=2692916 RepID=A0A6B0TUE3_9RHOB|nr:DMT family transporter [Oceanomicrobium pacificus]MXU65395.1 EamA family transporter [Oceanomicrobium pacificus]